VGDEILRHALLEGRGKKAGYPVLCAHRKEIKEARRQLATVVSAAVGGELLFAQVVAREGDMASESIWELQSSRRD
jgi:hypothetical protein